MYNFTAKFGKILEICKLFAKNIIFQLTSFYVRRNHVKFKKKYKDFA